MVKILILIILFIIGFLITANTSITIDPFSIKMETWKTAIGYTMIVIGIFVFEIDAFQRGQKVLSEKIIEYIEKQK